MSASLFSCASGGCRFLQLAVWLRSVRVPASRKHHASNLRAVSQNIAAGSLQHLQCPQGVVAASPRPQVLPEVSDDGLRSHAVRHNEPRAQRSRASIDAPNAVHQDIARLSSLSEFFSKLAQPAASSHASIEERDGSVLKVRGVAGRRRADVFQRDAVGDTMLSEVCSPVWQRALH